MSDQIPLPPDLSAAAEADFRSLPEEYQRFLLNFGGELGECVRDHVAQVLIGVPGGMVPASEANHASGVLLFTGSTICLCTAQHVVAKYRQRREEDSRIVFQAGNVSFDPEPRILFESAADDLVVLAMNTSDQSRIAARTWVCASWPPPPPRTDEYVAFAGLPSEYRVNVGHEIGFAVVGGVLPVISASPRNFKCHMDRATLIAVRGGHVPPPGTALGGMSGGPVFRLVDDKPQLCGIITDFGQSLEVFYGAPLALASSI